MSRLAHKIVFKKELWLVLFFVFWGVSISGVFGNAGVLQMVRLSQARREMNLRVRALENDRVRLQHLFHSLETDPLFQEFAIRETLGFVRQTELVFEFKGK